MLPRQSSFVNNNIDNTYTHISGIYPHLITLSRTRLSAATETAYGVSHIEQLPKERMESLRAAHAHQSARLCVRAESCQFLRSFRNLRPGPLPDRRLLAHAQPTKELVPVKPQGSLPSRQDGLVHSCHRHTQLLLALMCRARGS